MWIAMAVWRIECRDRSVVMSINFFGKIRLKPSQNYKQLKASLVVFLAFYEIAF